MNEAVKARSMVSIGRAVLACALFGTVAHAQQAPGPSVIKPAVIAPAVITTEPLVQPEPLIAPVVKARLADPSRVFAVTLARAPATAMSKSATVDSRTGVPLQIGFPRPVPGLQTSTATLAHLDWQGVSSGSRVAAFSVTSTGAQSLRVGIRVFAMPPAALLRFYAPAEGEVFEATGAQVKDAIERNLNAGEEDEDAHTYWSPVIEGEAAVVEVELPSGTSLETFAIAAPTVSHLVTSPGQAFAMPKAAAASCELDSMCYSAWSTQSNAVARIAFTSGGSSFLCTGTLVAGTGEAALVPFFLTANHCVSTQASASSMQSYWFYRSTACDSNLRNPSFVALGGGATLLYASATTDTSFMRLNSTPPAGAVHAGWQVGSILPLGTGLTGIHNPGGDLQKISFGSLTGYQTCSPPDAGQFSCSNSNGLSGTFYESTWSGGIAEPGSSGSGIFADNGHYLLGQLYGGTSSCSDSGADVYGRFDVAYNAALAPYLNGTATGGPAPPTGSGVTGGTPAPAPAFVPAFNYSALWWNPAESGWGLSVTQHNSALFAAWFVYDSNGSPRWVVMPNGTWTSKTSITGDLYATTGPASVNNFDPAQVRTQSVGSATLSFSSATDAVLTYTVNGVSGTKAITQEQFGVPDTTPTASYADLWWNASESGWGLSIAQQDRTLVPVWYVYGPSGQPQWFVMPGGTWSGNTYTGTLYRTASAPVPFYGGVFDPKSVAVSVAGSMSLTFLGVSTAIMTYTLDGVEGGLTITRQPF
jgi:lysyl endopeptidase